MRDEIVREIKRLAAENGGKPPGKGTFVKATAIRDGDWLGVYWARWSDALKEAGFEPNTLQTPLAKEFIFEKVAAAVRHFGHMPGRYEQRMYRTDVNPYFPSHGTLQNRFGSRAKLLAEFTKWIALNSECADLLVLFPTATTQGVADMGGRARATDGHVYLLRSGEHYKIGRSDEIERRVKEIRVALPEAATLVHSIRTDDPPGIEAYWHRRFSDRRANGEWFKLSTKDVAAFRRRKFQ